MSNLTAYIGIGANLGQPEQQVTEALDALAHWSAVRLKARSSLYRSVPIGKADQPDYCNAVCALQTGPSAHALFEGLLVLERAAGRVRDGTRWGPRTLDLDLLHVEGQTLQDAQLTLPHPEIARRNFVLIPLAEIAPQLLVPGVGAISEVAAYVGRAGLRLWSETSSE